MKQLALTLSLLLVSSLSFAGAKKAAHGEKGERGEKLRQELGLSVEQLKQFKEIRHEHKSQIKELRAKAKAAKEAFRTAMANPKSSREDLTAKFQALSEARQSAGKAKFEMMLEVRAILDEGQIAKFQELRLKRRAMKGKQS